jgi:hypothetical protein
MKNFREMRTLIGSLIWLGLIVFFLLVIRNATAKSPGGFEKLVNYACNQNLEVPIEFAQPQWIAVGDLVFSGDRMEYNPIGFVSRAGQSDSRTREIVEARHATVTFFSTAPGLSAQDYLQYHMPGNDTTWVIETMLPPEKRRELTKLIMESYVRDREVIINAIRPIVAKSFSEAAVILKEDLQTAFARHETQLRQIGEKYQSELIEEQLMPLLHEEIWPIIQEEGEPLARKMGGEIWREISVFRFAWRYMYDRSVGPDESLTERELNRFLQSKVAPILNSHTDEMMDLQNRIVARVAKNERVKDVVVSAFKTVTSDPEVHQAVTNIFQEVLLNNLRLRESLQRNWSHPEALAAIELTSFRLEPTINEIGVTLFGSPEEQITPEFARVLRHRILHKDSRWLTLHLAQPDQAQRSARPTRPAQLQVYVAEPTGQIPYAPGRKR